MATLAFTFVVIDYVGKWIAYFEDVIMIFFLAWLLAFILSPIANGLVHLFPRLPRAIAVVLVYSLLIVFIVGAILLIAQQLYSSINSLVSIISSGSLDSRLHDLLDPFRAGSTRWAGTRSISTAR